MNNNDKSTLLNYNVKSGFIGYFILSSLVLNGCAAPDYIKNKPVSFLNDVIETSHIDTVLQINRIATNVISSNAGIENKVVKYLEDSVMSTSFDKESIIMSIDNALSTITEQTEYLNAFNANEYDEDKVGNLQLAINEYDTSLQALKTAINEDNEVNIQAALQTMQSAISSLQAASTGM